MKFKYKFMLNRNPNYLNKIPLNELSWEHIDYALKRGFKYEDAIDGRYENYIEYIIYNLKNYDHYIDNIVNNINVLNNDMIKPIIIEKINYNVNENIKNLLEILKSNKDIYFINNFKGFNDLSEESKNNLYKIIVSNFKYAQLPDWLVKNNKELGELFLNENIDNITLYLKNNSDIFSLDEIAILLSSKIDSNKNLIFGLLMGFLKDNYDNLSNNVWDKIISNVSSNFNYISDIYRIFDESNTLSCVRIICKNIEKNRLNITKLDINNNNLKLLARLFNDNFVQKCLLNNECLFETIDLIDKNGLGFWIDSNLLFDFLKENNLFLTKDSPNYLKSNVDYVLLSLKNHSISMSDLDIKLLLNAPIEKLIELVDLGVFNKEDDEILQDYKRLISERLKNNLKKTRKNEFYINLNQINDRKYYKYIISNIPDGVNNIYLLKEDIGNIQFNDKINRSNNIKNFNINEINTIIEAIKLTNRNIKLTFLIDYYTDNDSVVDNHFLKQIVDLDYITFNSINKINSISGKELLLLNNTLDLMVEDIKNSFLSPYEKYIAVYNIVKSFKEYKFYQNNKDKDLFIYDQSRAIYLIMQNDYMVCVGYANLLQLLLKKVGINSIAYSEINHCLNYVRIEDTKYGINGIFKSDPTLDNEITDPINNAYNNINKNISNENFYLIDKILNSNNEYIQNLDSKQIDKLYNYIIHLFGELKSIKDKKEAIILFKNKYQSQENKSISVDDTVRAIVSIKEYINGRKYNEKEKRFETNSVIYGSFLGKLPLIDYSADMNMLKNKLFSTNLDNYMKISDSYKAFVFDSILKEIITNLNNSIKNIYNSIKISLSMQGGLNILYSDLIEEEITIIKNFYNNLNIDVLLKNINGKEYLIINLTEYFKKDLINDEMFEKIIKIIEECQKLKTTKITNEHNNKLKN